jgi:intraflagellar transport protein 88
MPLPETCCLDMQEFERKEKHLKARAATNLACLYLLEGDYVSAERYSDLALETDRYNARAYVNKGAIVAAKGDPSTAIQVLEEAVAIEPYCIEAVYDVG